MIYTYIRKGEGGRGPPLPRFASVPASKGHNLPLGLHVLSVSPADLRAVIVDDVRGVAWPHVIS